MKKGLPKLYSTATAFGWVGVFAGASFCGAGSIMEFFQEDTPGYGSLLVCVGVVFLVIGGIAFNQAQFIRLVMDESGAPSGVGPPSPS